VDRPALRRVESHFKGADGLRLFRRVWLPERPARVLVLVHGYAEHSGRYDHVARWFVARGAAVHAYDHRGHGRSAGPRTHVERFDHFLDDLERFLELVRAEHPEGPLTLVGHSMGGLVTAALLVERAPAVSSAVLSGPALALGPGVSRSRVALARVLRRLAPRLVLGSGLDAAGLSRDPAVVRAYLEDPHVHRTMTASLAAELLDAIPRTAAGAGRVAVPLLVVHGEEDPMCPVAGSRAFFAGVDCGGSRLLTYPGLRHEIFNEPEHERVFEDVRGWLEDLAR
jgi:alpha-beta hydrolase superfamily lysophospholipase